QQTQTKVVKSTADDSQILATPVARRLAKQWGINLNDCRVSGTRGLENGQQAENLPNKHTIIVPPGKTVTALLTADALGEWAIHCHLLYHMSA
ncbi:multicopper oxidase domain-containing protein, partial [Acinetobacter baumannii]|nr:multicopper oxidase domain-containing protein [Acinetobacter baumannii]